MDTDYIINVMSNAMDIALKFYDLQLTSVLKDDNSPVTNADHCVCLFIKSALKSKYPDIPYVSEEDYKENISYDYYWLVDPIDGTKEFLLKKDEFTINIALIKKNNPIFGIVGVPAYGTIYYADHDDSLSNNAYKFDILTEQTEIIKARKIDKNNTIIMVSNSHNNKLTEEFISKLDGKKTCKSAGSSLKILLIAEGKADIYPRLEGTCEWDTAAAHYILDKAGGKIVTYPYSNPYSDLNFLNNGELLYNKLSGPINMPIYGNKYENKKIQNPFFICYGSE